MLNEFVHDKTPQEPELSKREEIKHLPSLGSLPFFFQKLAIFI
ncbi:hypothetical protein SLUDD06_01433 [Streptococcus lutetiensis]|nr:hypothetical protein SLUDD06_01433 [Streptococcus lutetiensis]